MGSVAAAQVHKTATAEVFLSGAEQRAAQRFHVDACWPTAHPVYQARSGAGTDPVLLVETLRQTAIYLSHRYFDVPQQNPFIFGDVTLDIVGRRTARRAPQSPHARLEATCALTRPPRPGKLAMRLEAVIRQGERVCARGTVSWLAVSPQVYRALRSRGATPPPAPTTTASPAPGAGSQPPTPAMTGATTTLATTPATTAALPAAQLSALVAPGLWPAPSPESLPAGGADLAPAAVGRSRAADVLLTRPAAGPAGRWLLRVDQQHPVFFDHPSDHVPGMVLLEALRQAGHATLAPVAAGPDRPIALTGCQIAFRAFCELTSPVVIEAAHTGAAVIGRDGVQALELAVCARQQDRTVADGMLRWAVGAAGRTLPALPEVAR